MYRHLATAVLVVALVAGGSAAVAAPRNLLQPEGCEAANPGQPTCTFTATEDTQNTGGAVGYGTWTVTIKRGKQKFTLKDDGSGGGSTATFIFKIGDKVTVKATSQGSAVAVGTVF